MYLTKIAAAVGFLAFTSLAQAVPITGVINTGAGLSDGQLDNNYKLSVLGSTVGLLASGQNAGYASTNVHPWWFGPSSNSAWLTPFTNGQQSLDPLAGGLGTYIWTLSFDLDQYFSTANLAGRFAFDNDGAVFLNGTLLASGVQGYASWTDFSAGTSLFKEGTNQLVFVVKNTAQDEGNPTGLRVEFTSSNVPEPESYALMLGGLGLLGVVSRRRQRK